MRISDWSSDVCSSDLGRADAAAHAGLAVGVVARLDVRRIRARALAVAGLAAAEPGRLHRAARGLVRGRDRPPALRGLRPAAHQRGGQPRSEEHTSELQSLMRTSYAVFCLKKKNNRKGNHHHADRKSHTYQTNNSETP